MNSERLVSAGALALMSLLVVTACSEQNDLPPPKTDQIVIEYVYPTDPEHRQLHDLFKSRQMLEKLKIFLSPFRLRWPLYLTLTDCDGEPDAMYGDDEITICYEFIQELQATMPDATTPSGITPFDAALGPFMDTVLHEFAHALFDYADVPVLGREEDAADQVAALIYLNLGRDEARRLIMGTVYAYLFEVQDTDPPTMDEYADEHSTSEQRAFNLMCMAYGADPGLFEDVVEKGGMPEFRKEICPEEYELVAIAFEKLIGPHIDPELAAEVFDGSWLPDRESLILHDDVPRRAPEDFTDE